MFGYFRPFAAIVNSAHRSAFNAHYCRLCYCLRSLGGQVARAFTTFDATVYEMAYSISAEIPQPPSLPCQRFKKSNMRLCEKNEIGMKLARITLIAFGEKIRDNKIDGDHKFQTALIELFAGKAIRNAQQSEPEITEISRQGNDKVNELQESGADLHTVLDAYGKSVADIFATFEGITPDAVALIKAIAEWTFFVDMLVDYDEDFKENKVNSFRKEDCPTLQEYFNKNYAYIMEQNKRVSSAIMKPLFAIQKDNDEWKALYHILTHALNTVVPSLLVGDDVTFHYLKEVSDNFMDAEREKRLFNRREKNKLKRKAEEEKPKA